LSSDAKHPRGELSTWQKGQALKQPGDEMSRGQNIQDESEMTKGQNAQIPNFEVVLITTLDTIGVSRHSIGRM